jgi:hypothetical protein
MEKDTDWNYYESSFTTKLLIDGSRSSGPLMRRQINHEWKYRRMTKEEETEYMSGTIW